MSFESPILIFFGASGGAAQAAGAKLNRPRSRRLHHQKSLFALPWIALPVAGAKPKARVWWEYAMYGGRWVVSINRGC